MAAHPLHRVGLQLFWFICAAIPEQIGCYNAVPGCLELGDLVPPVPARAWESVQEEERGLLGVGRRHVDEGVRGAVVEPC